MVTITPDAATERSEQLITSTRDDLVTTAFGTWLILGLFVDGWAHLNLPGLETFFTPWHGVLYSGFAAGALWLAVLGLRGRRLGLPWSRALPVGFPVAAVGVLLFGAGGMGDMVWHVVFGVETGIDALVSPTHLVLLTGGALALTAALRAGWARPVAPGGPTLLSELPAMLSLTLVTALGAFFLLYVSVFTGPAAAQELTRIPEGAPGHEAAELSAVAGLAGYLVTTVLLVAPLVLAQRLGRRPRGAAVVVIGVVAWLSVAVGGLSPYGVAVAVAVTVAAVGVEVAMAAVEGSRLPRTLQLPALAATVPLLLWPAQLVALALTDGVRWPVELWSGVVGLSTLVAVALGVVTGWAPGRDRAVR
jgi:hypothetical protein